MRAVALTAILLLATTVQAANDNTDAEQLVYVISADDPKDDNTGPCPLAGCPVPGTYNRENDILNVRVTDDLTTFVIRIEIQTCSFTAPSGFAFVNIEFGGALSGFEGTVAFDHGCEDPRFIHSDSLTATTDPDAELPGIRVFADPANNLLYILADYSDLQLSEGDTITFGRIHTGRQWTDPGRYTFGLDEAAAPAFTVGSGWLLNLPAEEVPDEVEPIIRYLEHSEAKFKADFTNATETVIVNWTLPAYEGNVSILTDGQGSIRIQISDADGKVMYNQTGSKISELKSLAGPGPWNATVTLQNYTGPLTLAFTPPEEKAAPPAPGGTTPAAAPPAESKDNSTLPPPAKEESPSLPAVFAIALLGALAYLRKRRT